MPNPNLGFLLAMTLTLPAVGVTRCVKLSPSSTCTYNGGIVSVDWQTTCDGIPVRGIGVCGRAAVINNPSDFVVGFTQDSIIADDVAICWCKIIHPVESKWVLAYNYTGTDITSSECQAECGLLCGNYIYSGYSKPGASTVRQALLSNFIY